MSWSGKLSVVTTRPGRRWIARPATWIVPCLALIAVVCLNGAGAPAVATPALPTPPTVAAPVQDLESIDRETIFSLVRDHRRAADEASTRNLADTIYDESVAAGVDPLMIASIVAKESSFRTRVVSRRGAVGLMQLRPFVARDLADREEISWEGTKTLHRPEVNLRLGIVYYKELVDRFEGDTHTALTAYNYGPTRVRRQIRKGVYSGSSYADGILGLYDELNVRRAKT